MRKYVHTYTKRYELSHYIGNKTEMKILNVNRFLCSVAVEIRIY